MEATRAALIGSALVHGLALALVLLLPSPPGEGAGRAARVDLAAVVVAPPPPPVAPEPARQTLARPHAMRVQAGPSVVAPPLVQQSLQPVLPMPVAALPVARPAAASAPPAPVPVAVPSAALRSDYAARLWSHVAAHRPTGFGLSGEARVTFTLDRAGQVIAASISRSSGQALLDKAALRAVRQSSPCPPPPAGIDDAALTFAVAVRFGGVG